MKQRQGSGLSALLLQLQKRSIKSIPNHNHYVSHSASFTNLNEKIIIISHITTLWWSPHSTLLPSGVRVDNQTKRAALRFPRQDWNLLATGCGSRWNKGSMEAQSRRCPGVWKRLGSNAFCECQAQPAKSRPWETGFLVKFLLIAMQKCARSRKLWRWIGGTCKLTCPHVTCPNHLLHKHSSDLSAREHRLLCSKRSPPVTPQAMSGKRWRT